MTIRRRSPRPFEGQKPGTSGLRKKTPCSGSRTIWRTTSRRSSTAVGGSRADARGRRRRPLLQRRGDPDHPQDGRRQRRRARLVGQGGLLSTPAASNLIRKRGAIGGIVLSASHNPGGPDGDFGVKFNIANGGPAPEKVTDAIFARTQAIERYRIAGGAGHRTSSALRRDPARRDDGRDRRPGRGLRWADGAAVRLRRIRELFRVRVSDALRRDARRHRPVRRRILEGHAGRPAGTVVNGVPLPDFGGHHPDPNLVHAPSCSALMYRPDAPDMGAASDGDGDRNLVLGRACSWRPPTAWPCSPPTRIWRRATRAGSRAWPARCRPAAPSTGSRRSSGSRCFETPTGWKFFGNLLDAGQRHLVRRGERRHRLRPRAREGRALGRALWLNILAAPRRAGGRDRPGHWASSAATTIRATTTRRSTPDVATS